MLSFLRRSFDQLGGARLGEGASDPFQAEKPIVRPRVTTNLEWESAAEATESFLSHHCLRGPGALLSLEKFNQQR